GRHPSIPLWAIEVGFKYKMSNMQAAMGLAQLERIAELLAQKRWINERYRRNLAGANTIVVSSDLPECRSIHWMTSIEVLDADDHRREAIMAELKERSIDSRPVFRPLSGMPMFQTRSENPVARRIGQSAINLPSAHNLTGEDIDYVSEAVLAVCRR